MAGPLEPRIELRSKWGRFKSSKKALNAPLVFCCGGIPVGADFACSDDKLDCVTLPGEYMWPENPDGSVGSPSTSVTKAYDNKNGYSSLTDFHVYTPMYTSGPNRKSGKHWKDYSAKTFATESWNELQTILTRYKIQPSAKIILGFSGGVGFVTTNIATLVQQLPQEQVVHQIQHQQDQEQVLQQKHQQKQVKNLNFQLYVSY